MTILCDCFVFLNPIWVIQGLRLGTLQKSTLYAGFILGFVTTVFSILRMTNIPSIASKGGDSTMLVVYSDLEVNAGVSSHRVDCGGPQDITNSSVPGHLYVVTHFHSTSRQLCPQATGQAGAN